MLCMAAMPLYLLRVRGHVIKMMRKGATGMVDMVKKGWMNFCFWAGRLPASLAVGFWGLSLFGAWFWWCALLDTVCVFAAAYGMYEEKDIELYQLVLGLLVLGILIWMPYLAGLRYWFS